MPGALILPAWYLPEIVVWAIAIPIVLTRLPSTGRDLRVFAGAAGVVGLWSLTGYWNDVAVSTIAAGARSEFRFLPLIVIALFSGRVREDARFYGRILLCAASVEAVIALLEAVGGEPIRAILAPSYTLVVGGAVVGTPNPPLETIFGTFAHRNLLGAFLAFSAIVVASAGPKGLGLRRRTVIMGWSLLAAGTLAAVSREGVIALVVGTAFVLSFQHRIPAARIGLLIGAAVAVVSFAIKPENPPPADAGPSSWSRWGDVVSTRGWSATSTDNFRLYYMVGTAQLVARDSPVVGFGLGTASDPRFVQAGSSPLERYPAGRLASELNFYNDGNWTVLLLETGFAGVLLLVTLLTFLTLYGCKVAQAGYWMGGALAGLVLATAVLGFFAPILQVRGASFILWLFAGLAAAAMPSRHEQRRRDSARAFLNEASY
jgi:hypothetical protein